MGTKTVASLATVALVAGLSAQQPTQTNSIGMEFVLIQPGTMAVGVFRPPYAKPPDPNAPAPAGRGAGRGGNGTTLAPQVFADGDKNKDGRLDRDELSSVADAWFDRLDSSRSGRLTVQDFMQGFAAVMAPTTPAAPAAAAGGRGGAGPTLYGVADANRDTVVTRPELKTLFETWFTTWAAGASSVTTEQVVAGLNAALPQPAAPARGNPLTPADYARIEQMARASYTDGFPVRIERPFHIGKYEVTQAQWTRVMGTNPSLFQGALITGDASRHPVERVAWSDAQAFIRRLNALEKTNVYRLPTEFEWEYAARGGGDADTPWTEIREQAVMGYNAHSSTQPVGTKKPNAWGLYDMLGNVWEWTQDYYNEKIFADPTPPKSGSQHVLKGGGFVADVKNAIPATHAAGPGSGFDVGFRVVREVR